MEYQVEGTVKIIVMLDIEANSEEEAKRKAKEILIEDHRLDSNMPKEDIEKWSKFDLIAFEIE